MSDSSGKSCASLPDVGATNSVIWLLCLYAMLDSKGGAINRDRVRAFTKELRKWDEDENASHEALFDPAARLIADELLRQRKTGLSRDYVTRREETSAPKGRILMGDTIRLMARGQARVACRVDEFVEDSYENRVIKRTVDVLLKGRGKDSYRGGISAVQLKRLRSVRPLLDRVSDLKGNAVDWTRVRNIKKTRPYRVLMMLCQLVLSQEDTINLLRMADDEVAACDLFEKGVRGYLKVWHPELTPQDKWFNPYDREGGRPVLRGLSLHTDISLYYKRGGAVDRVMVVDTKLYAFKNVFEKGSGEDYRIVNRNNCHQLNAYVALEEWAARDGWKAANGVSDIDAVKACGVLLYGCNVEWCVAWDMRGRKMCARGLDLSKGAAYLERQLDALAEAARGTDEGFDSEFFKDDFDELCSRAEEKSTCAEDQNTCAKKQDKKAKCGWESKTWKCLGDALPEKLSKS